MHGSHDEERQRKTAFERLWSLLARAVVERGRAEAIVSEFVDSQGFSFFSYAIACRRDLSHPGGIVMSSYPGPWLDRYRSRSYDLVDEIVCSSRRETLPFYWGSPSYLRQVGNPARQVCLEAQEFGIGEGITVPVHGPAGECGAFSAVHDVGTRNDVEPWGDRYRHLVALAPLVHAFGMDVGPTRGETVSLTGQEQRCLRWTLEGKTAWEVAQILGLSKPTIEYHVQKAMRKLNATNKTQAAVSAKRLGLI